MQNTPNRLHSPAPATRALVGFPVPHGARAPGEWRRVGWIVLCAIATLLGLVSLRYLLPHVPFPVRNSSFVLRRPWLVTHVVSASVALVAGPWQFRESSRTSRKELHRRIGWVYVIAVLIGWVSSIPVALHAPSGVIAQAGYLALGAAWITTTAVGLLTAIDRQLEQHRRWMTRSYALAASAITLRFMLPICLISGMPFKHAEPLCVWACWLFNLCCAQYLLRASTGSLQRAQRFPRSLQTCG